MKTPPYLPSVPARWIALECRSEPHKEDQAKIPNLLLRKSLQWRWGLLLKAVHKQLDSEHLQRWQFSRRMLWLVLFESFPHACGFKYLEKMANFLYVHYLILVEWGHLVKAIFTFQEYYLLVYHNIGISVFSAISLPYFKLCFLDMFFYLFLFCGN